MLGGIILEELRRIMSEKFDEPVKNMRRTNQRLEGFNDWGGRGYDDFVPVEVTKKNFRRLDYMIPYMVGKFAPNSSHLTRGLVKYIPDRGYFRAVPSQNGDKYVTNPSPPIIVELVFSRLEQETRQPCTAT